MRGGISPPRAKMYQRPATTSDDDRSDPVPF